MSEKLTEERLAEIRKWERHAGNATACRHIRALLHEIERLRHEAGQNAEALRELWAALFDGESPVDWLAEVETMKAAKAQLHEIGRATHEVVEQLRQERDEARAGLQWSSEAPTQEGFYWWRYGVADEAPEVVVVFEVEGEGLYGQFMSWDGGEPVARIGFSGSQWAGPLVAPEGGE